MAFEDAVQQVLKDEGGFFHNQQTGEVVNRGITLKFMQAVVDKDATEDTIKNLTQDDTVAIYNKYFWQAPHFDEIKNPQVASLLFYLGVNMGIPSSIKLAQTSCFYLGKKISIDGVMGPATLDAINTANAFQLHAAICSLAESRYKDIVKDNPVLAPNLTGWLIRLSRYTKDAPDNTPLTNIIV